jgi:dipeptidyl aminopeptidase/acylaminoacyl peptidase
MVRLHNRFARLETRQALHRRLATDTISGTTRQFTFTAAKNETAPAFSPDGASLAFLSDRDGTGNQAYLMPVGGGEARKISDVAGGITSFAFSDDGKWIAMLGRQIYLYAVGGDETAKLALRHSTPVEAFAWSPGSAKLYFSAPDSLSAAERKRIDLKFDVRVVDQPRPPVHLWEMDLSEKKERRLTQGSDFTVREFQVAKTGGWIAVLSGSSDRYDTDIATRKREAWLLHAPSAKLNRLTDNAVSESLPVVSPGWQMGRDDSARQLLLLPPNAHLCAVNRRQSMRDVLASSWDYDPQGVAWAGDSQALTFEAGVGTSTRGYSLKLSGGTPAVLTEAGRNVNLTYHQPSNQYFMLAQDPEHPADYYLAGKRLSNANPQAAEFALGRTETIQWKSSDGAMVEGLLVHPVGYMKGTRYPLVVQIHGGPASATTTAFAGSYSRYDHVYAVNGYALLHPNYRGSTNYGEKFKTAIVGNYFQQGFEDIMSGVDHLIAQGIADPDKLGMMGWSAGGHWSNWTLTHTNRFKAISSGAGAMNWVSMYAQNDSQANREHYFNGTPYDNFDHWMAMSPIKYIKNARTPTLIHVGHDDPRVPRPQSEELHMALKKLGVPTEFIVYPRMGHGLTDPRYQMVKMVAEFNWFEKWIKGKEKWLDWQEILDTVPGSAAKTEETTGDVR